MPSARFTAFVLALLAAGTATCTAPGAARAQSDERCSGTLCDLYYRNSPPPAPAPAKPAAPTPIMAPTYLMPGYNNPQPATPVAPGAQAQPSKVQVQGGGLLNMLKGGPQERCSGTLCDLYYGGPPPEKQAEQPAAPPAMPAPETVAAEAPVEPTPVANENVVDTVRRAPPSCAAKAGDPWSCYRR